MKKIAEKLNQGPRDQIGQCEIRSQSTTSISKASRQCTVLFKRIQFISSPNLKMSAVSNPSGRSSKPIPTLRTLPPEILSHILSFLSATPLSDVSRTSRKLYLAANDDVVWQRLCLQEYDVNPTSYTHFPYERVKSFYVGLLRRWGWLLGFWQVMQIGAKKAQASSRIFFCRRRTIPSSLEGSSGFK